MASSQLPSDRQTVLERYDHLARTGRLVGDPEQRRIAMRFDRLIDEIAEKRLQRKSSALGWMFARRKPKQEPVRGLYLHGGVGRTRNSGASHCGHGSSSERLRYQHSE